MGDRQGHGAERHYWGQEAHVVHPLLSSVSTTSHNHTFTRPGELGLTRACGTSRIKPWDSLWDGLTCASCTWWRWCQGLAASLPPCPCPWRCHCEHRVCWGLASVGSWDLQLRQRPPLLPGWDGDSPSIPLEKTPWTCCSVHFHPYPLTSDGFHAISGVIATVTHMPVAQRFLFTWGHLESSTCLLESFVTALTQLPQREGFSATLAKLHAPGLSVSNKSRPWGGNFPHQAPWMHPCWNDSVLYTQSSFPSTACTCPGAISWGMPGLEGRAQVMLATAVTFLGLWYLFSSHIKGLGKHSTHQKTSRMEHVLLMAGCCSS